jgi:hypothetical protein
VVDDAFVRRLVEQGVRVREYRLPHNGSVDCTVTPDDDVVVARLEAPLGGVARLDMVEMDADGKGRTRLQDIPFRADSGGVVVVSRTDELRALPASTTRMRLLAVDATGERVIGEYIFRHTPHAGAG